MASGSDPGSGREEATPKSHSSALRGQKQILTMLGKINQTLNNLIEKIEMKGINKEEDPKYTVSGVGSINHIMRACTCVQVVIPNDN